MTFSLTKQIPFRKKAKLNLAYRQTSYRVVLTHEQISIHINRYNKRLDKFLNALGYKNYAVISAANPSSELLDKTRNRARNQRLKNKIKKNSLRFYPTVARANARNWPDEIGWFIPNYELSEIISLGRQFNQLAIILGEAGKTAKLIWLHNLPDPSKKPAFSNRKR